MFRLVTVMSVVITIAVVMILRGRVLSQSVVSRQGRYPLLECLVAFAMWFSVIVLAVTGFLGASLLGKSLSGFLTLIHVSFGALFAVSLAALAVFRAEAYSLTMPETSSLFSMPQKISFWIMGICGLGLILSILVAMLRVFGTDGQHISTEIHRYSALIALLATIVYAGTARKRG